MNTCYNCRKPVHDNDVYETENGMTYCNTCGELATDTCGECGLRFPVDDIVAIDLPGGKVNWLCDKCIEELELS